MQALLPLLLAITAFVGPLVGGWSSFLTPALAFGLVPILDHVTTKDTNSKKAWPDWVFEAILLGYVAIHFILLFWAAERVGAPALATYERMGLIASVGVVTGALGLTFAHELIHRRSNWERRVGEALLVTVAYGHFAVAHVHQHHRFVGTPQDAATARKGQSLYSFLAQVVPGAFLFSWRLKRTKTIGYVLATAFVASLMTYLGGVWGLVLFLGQTLIAIFQIEAVNFVEHYGLQRKELGEGKFEPVKAHHSWDSDRRVTGKLLIHLQRHSDHHLHAAKKYQDLELVESSHQLPTGYAGMVIMALFPPLYRRVMDPRIRG